jgi:hypothetical protein
MEVYTSYFGMKANIEKEDILPVSIALWKPRWYEGLEYKKIAPKAFMLRGDYDQDEYIRFYEQWVLNKLNVDEVIKDLERLGDGKDIALLCYEKPGEFCHRHLFAEWMLEQTGWEIEEFRPQPKKQKSSDFEPEQFLLF